MVLQTPHPLPRTAMKMAPSMVFIISPTISMNCKYVVMFQALICFPKFSRPAALVSLLAGFVRFCSRVPFIGIHSAADFHCSNCV